jgi:tripartite-type tricarboxylate transporter receptor subunit TctC
MLGLQKSKDAFSNPIDASGILAIILPYNFTSKALRNVLDDVGRKHPEGYFMEARPGASGLIATRFILNQTTNKPHIMVSTASTSALNYILKPQISPNPLEVFQPLGIICEYNAALITARDDVETFEDLVRLAKGSPRVLNVSTPGVGSLYHVTYLMMAHFLGFEATHVPYSAGKHTFAIYNGDADFGFVSLPEAMAWQSVKKVKILAVTSQKRVPDLPGVRSLREIHPQLVISDSISLVGKKDVSKEFAKKINGYLVNSLKSKEIQTEFSKYGYVVSTDPSIEFHHQKMIAEIKQWKELIKKLPINQLS